MKNIIAPIDFSKCSLNALKVAASLTKKSGGKLYIMHILNMPEMQNENSIATYHDSGIGAMFVRKITERLEKLIKTKTYLQGIHAVPVLAFNSFFESIADKAEEVKADLIVMGSQGTTGGAELIGSNTERVIRRSDIPVLVIKKEHELFDINDIVFASNFEQESYTIFDEILEFARLFEAKIHLLKVNTPQRFETTLKSQELMDKFVKETDIKLPHSTNIFNDLTIEQGIHNFADWVQADMIAMETHGRSGVKHLLWGSITEDVANHAKKPVLSVRISG